MMDNIGQQTNAEAGEIGQGQGTAAGPENNATITSSQSGGEGSLENDGNFQRDSRRQEALSLSESPATSLSTGTIPKRTVKKDNVIEKENDSSPSLIDEEDTPLDDELDKQPNDGSSSLKPNENIAEVNISGGTFDRANFGPQTNTKHIEANTIEHATIKHVHHHYGGDDKSEESSSTSGETGAGPKQKMFHGQEAAVIGGDVNCKTVNFTDSVINIMATNFDREAVDITSARVKQSPPEGCVQICSDIFMYKMPLKRGTNVFEGYQKHVFGSKVPLAIKRISPYDDKNLREVGHLASLASHPNIVQIIRSETREGIVPELYIAMELCSSQTLQDYLKENCEKNTPFDFDQTMIFTRQLVSGIKHIHQNKIAHRDLKPENILISLNGGQIKVSDFGISKEIRDGNKTKQTSLGEGTDGYRAPETFKSEDISQSADIFSLGLVMYPMWSNGKHAFGGDFHMRNPNIINNKGRDLSGLVISGTKENQLLNLIDWMLQPDPEKRPTIEQVAQHTFFNSGPNPTAEELNTPQRAEGKQQPQQQSMYQESSRPSCSGHQLSSDATVEDPNDHSNLRQQPVEESSPKRSANAKTLTERFQSALRLPSASKKVSSKEDPNNRSNLRQQPLEKSSPKRSANVKTLKERFQSALRLPSASKKVAFKEGSNTPQSAEGKQQPPQQPMDEESFQPSCSGHQLSSDATVEGCFGPLSLLHDPQSNPSTHKNDSKSLIRSTEQKLSTCNDEIQIGHNMYIYKHHKLCSGNRVYKGIRKLLDGEISRLLAVKIFYIDETDKKLYNDFVSEARKMEKCDHPNIVRFMHCGEVLYSNLGGYYIAMELCHQMTLADVNVASIRRDQKQNLFLQICEGVDYLHKEEVAHMDLKPGNILFSRDGKKVVVSDFGLSKCMDKEVRDGKTYITRSSSKYGGTRGWISVEMIRRIITKAKTSKKQDTKPDFFKTDIFSLGLVGHHIFYGCHPFRNIEDPEPLFYCEANIYERKLPSIGPQVPKSAEPDVTDLFGKMLSHDPLIRPTTEEVLQHWMFWSPTKKLTFLTDMYDRYLYNRKFREKVEKYGTEEQKLAYEELPNTSDADTSASGTCSSQTQDQVFPKSENLFATQTSGNTEKQNERSGVGREEKIMRMREVMGDRWMDKINDITKKTKIESKGGDEANEKTKNESKGGDDTNKKPKKKAKGNKKSNKSKLNGNCLVNGIRLIRNNIAHEVDESEDRKFATVQKWVTAFPKLWPYIHDILERDFTEEDKKEYNCRNTNTGDIGVKSLLEIKESKDEFAQGKGTDHPNHQS